MDTTLAITPTTTPRGRGRRGPARGVAAELSRLTGRDRWLLRLLAEHRVLTTEQITAIAFDHPRRARRRLLLLHQRDVLDRFRGFTGRGSQSWRWTLGPVGAAVIAAAGGKPTPRPAAVAAATDRLATSPRLAHQLAVNLFFCQLAAHARAHPESALRRWWSEPRATAAAGGLVRPDGAGLWQTGQNSVAFWLEMDRGSEPLARLTAKLTDGYRRLAGTPLASWPVLFWLPTTAREAHLHTLLARHTTTAPVPVATTAADQPAAHPAGPAWRLPGHPSTARFRLHELPTAPAGGGTV